MQIRKCKNRVSEKAHSACPEHVVSCIQGKESKLCTSGHWIATGGSTDSSYFFRETIINLLLTLAVGSFAARIWNVGMWCGAILKEVTPSPVVIGLDCTSRNRTKVKETGRRNASVPWKARRCICCFLRLRFRRYLMDANGILDRTEVITLGSWKRGQCRLSCSHRTLGQLTPEGWKDREAMRLKKCIITKASYASWSSSCFSKEYARGWTRGFTDTINVYPPPAGL